ALAADRVVNRSALLEIIEPIFLKKSVRDWVGVFEENKVPTAPVQTVEQLVSEPQVAAMEMLIPMDSVTGNSVQLVGVPVKLSETPGVPRRRSPGLGEHTTEVLAEMLQIGPEEVERLRAEGVL
ncbi:MAG: CoA transferase, partial [Thermomicrobiales bacterium]